MQRRDLKVIVCVTGMPGAGKSTVSKTLGNIGFMIINMGNIVRDEAYKRNLSPTDNNLGALMLELRNTLGSKAIAELCINRIKDTESNLIVIDGLRSISEVEVFQTQGKVFTIAIHASPHKRYRYLSSRRRADDPLSWNDFRSRDLRELSIGIGSSIALADEIISNNCLSIQELRQIALNIVKRMLKEVDN